MTARSEKECMEGSSCLMRLLPASPPTGRDLGNKLPIASFCSDEDRTFF